MIHVMLATSAVHPAASKAAAHTLFSATAPAPKTRTARRRDFLKVTAAAARGFVRQCRFVVDTRCLETIVRRTRSA